MTNKNRNKKLITAKFRKPAIFLDGRARKMVGILLLVFASFLTVALYSYMNTWQQDQDKVLNATNFWQFFANKNLIVQNNAGRFGAYVSHQLVYNGFGVASFLLILLLGIYCINLLAIKKYFHYLKSTFHILTSILVLSPLLSYVFNAEVITKAYTFQYGGLFGNTIVSLLNGALGDGGTLAIFIGLAILLLVFWFNPIFHLPFWHNLFTKKPETETSVISPTAVKEDTMVMTTESTLLIDETIFDNTHSQHVPEEITAIETAEDANDFEIPEPFVFDNNPAQAVELDTEINEELPPINQDELQLEVQQTIPEEVEPTSDMHITTEEPYDPSLELRNYQFPTVELLEDRQNIGFNIDKEELENNKNQIIQTLKSFKIDIQKISATIGPTVTLYEIVPAEGIRISKIRNLEDDIALNLAALGIRIIAPIPGKGTIGIEVPNKNKQIVNMRTLLSSEKFKTTDAALPIAIGKTIANENYIVDLAKMPHLLMAGATGQGKSVGINALLVSLLYKKHPSQLKFVLVDPKKVELSVYRKIEKHFLAKLPNEEEAIITDTKKVINTVNALCIEMDERYDLLKNAGARNLSEYNAKFIKRKLNPEKGHKFLPYIVLVIDEFADLIMTAGKEIETPIARLAQLARAIGIHLIIATQRPSVNVITGTIKANFPARMAFKVSSKIDSRTILDTGGADQLIGRGDMLISNGGELVRVQCAFVDTPEVEAVVDFIGDQRGYPTAHDLPEYIGADEDVSMSVVDINNFDKMFREAALLVVTSESGSTSMLQRRFNLGYNRAGRIMDQMEAVGIVGPSIGSKAREVLVKTEAELLQVFEEIGV